MKKIFLISLTLVLLLFAGSALAVPNIYISDLTESSPTVTPSGFPTIPFVSNPIVATANEFANVTGALTSNFLTAGLYGAEMLENPGDTSYRGVSDIAVLLVSPRIPIVNTQAFNLTFISDGALSFTLPILGNFSGFDAAVDAYLLGVSTGTVKEVFNQFETGNFQLLFDYTGLKVYAQSDVTAPIPGSLLLLGSGILGMLGIGVRRKSA